MGGVSGGALAAAVSEAGGLGLVGGGYGDPGWLERELDTVAGATGKPWGAGVITWAASEDAVRLILSYRPAAVFLSFGDPAPFGALVRQAGVRLICQVQDVAGARQAAAAGADVIVAQGTEAGGHGSRRATLPLVPAVADAVAPVPVLAAGGITDGRGVAAALMLGAQGAVVGTRFCATPEALYPDWAKKQLVDGGGDETSRTQVFDIARGLDWPDPYTGRALRNAFTDAWDGREEELRASRAGPGAVHPRPPGRGSRRRPGLGGGRDRPHHRGRAGRGASGPDHRPGRRAAARSPAPTGSLDRHVIGSNRCSSWPVRSVT